jgi:hypothetical protein
VAVSRLPLRYDEITYTTRNLSFYTFSGVLGFQIHFEGKMVIPSVPPRLTNNNKDIEEDEIDLHHHHHHQRLLSR